MFIRKTLWSRIDTLSPLSVISGAKFPNMLLGDKLDLGESAADSCIRVVTIIVSHYHEMKRPRYVIAVELGSTVGKQDITL